MSEMEDFIEVASDIHETVTRLKYYDDAYTKDQWLKKLRTWRDALNDLEGSFFSVDSDEYVSKWEYDEEVADLNSQILELETDMDKRDEEITELTRKLDQVREKKAELDQALRRIICSAPIAGIPLALEKDIQSACTLVSKRRRKIR